MSDDQNDGRMSFEAAVHYIQRHPGSAAFTAMPVFGERSEDEDQRAEGAKVFIIEADGAGSHRLRFIAGPFFASVLGDEDMLPAAEIPDPVKALRFLPTRLDEDWLSEQIQVLIQKLMAASGQMPAQMPDYAATPAKAADPGTEFPVSFIGRREPR